jgi:hypothetical protein
MARFHRILDGKTGEVTIKAFTAEEEAKADAIEAIPAPTDADIVQNYFDFSDKDKLMLKMFLSMENRIRALEGNATPATKQDLLNWLVNQIQVL